MFRWLSILLFAVSCSLAGCANPIAIDSIPADAMPIDPYPVGKINYIRTRIVIEESRNQTARSIDDIINDLALAEFVYRDLHLKFIIVGLALAYHEQDWALYSQVDAKEYPTCLSVYYVYGRNFGDTKKQLEGLTAFPWQASSTAIVIHGPTADTYTFAHEIGHYLGLYHTFDEDDLVSDTYNKKEYAVIKPGDEYSNYNNVMNYQSHDKETFATKGQIDRMRWFLEHNRRSVLMQDIFAPLAPDNSVVHAPSLLDECAGEMPFPWPPVRGNQTDSLPTIR